MGRPPLPVGTFGRICFLSQPSGEVQARARFRDYDGRTRLVSKTARTRAAAERALKTELSTRLATGDRGAVTAGTRMADLADAWLEAPHGWSTGTMRTYRSVVGKQVKPAFGLLCVREVTPGAVSRALAAMAASSGPGAAKTARACLSGMLTLAVEDGAIGARLTEERIAALNALGFVWDQGADDFERGLTALQEFVTVHGHARVSKDHRTEDGFALGVWVDSRRQERRRGRLPVEQMAALEDVRFVWDPYAEDFARGLAALEEFRAEHGHTRVPRPHRTGDGFLLGLWVRRRRQERRAGRLTGERVAALDARGFVWS